MEDKAKTVLPDDTESDEGIKKLLSDGGDIEITVKGEKISAYWQNTGFEKRPFIKAHSYRRVQEAENDGLLTKKEIADIKMVHGELLILDPAPSCLSPVKVDGVDDYTYNKDIGAIYFPQKIDKEIKISYYTYNELATYEEIYHNAITTALIFYSVKEKDNHKKNQFESIDYVGSLQIEDIASIMGAYAKDIKVSGDEIKKSPGLQVSEKKDDTPSDTE